MPFAVSRSEECLIALIALVSFLALVDLKNVPVEHALLRKGSVATITFELRGLVHCQDMSEQVSFVSVGPGTFVTLKLFDVLVVDQVVSSQLVGSREGLITFVAQVSPNLVVNRHHVPLKLVRRVEGLCTLVTDIVVDFLVDVQDVSVKTILFNKDGRALETGELFFNAITFKNLPLNPLTG